MTGVLDLPASDVDGHELSSDNIQRVREFISNSGLSRDELEATHPEFVSPAGYETFKFETFYSERIMDFKSPTEPSFCAQVRAMDGLLARVSDRRIDIRPDNVWGSTILEGAVGASFFSCDWPFVPPESQWDYIRSTDDRTPGLRNDQAIFLLYGGRAANPRWVASTSGLGSFASARLEYKAEPGAVAGPRQFACTNINTTPTSESKPAEEVISSVRIYCIDAHVDGVARVTTPEVTLRDGLQYGSSHRGPAAALDEISIALSFHIPKRLLDANGNPVTVQSAELRLDYLPGSAPISQISYRRDSDNSSVSGVADIPRSFTYPSVTQASSQFLRIDGLVPANYTENQIAIKADLFVNNDFTRAVASNALFLPLVAGPAFSLQQAAQRSGTSDTAIHFDVAMGQNPSGTSQWLTAIEPGQLVERKFSVRNQGNQDLTFSLPAPGGPFVVADLPATNVTVQADFQRGRWDGAREFTAVFQAPTDPATHPDCTGSGTIYTCTRSAILTTNDPNHPSTEVVFSGKVFASVGSRVERSIGAGAILLTGSSINLGSLSAGWSRYGESLNCPSGYYSEYITIKNENAWPTSYEIDYVYNPASILYSRLDHGLRLIGNTPNVSIAASGTYTAQVCILPEDPGQLHTQSLIVRQLSWPYNIYYLDYSWQSMPSIQFEQRPHTPLAYSSIDYFHRVVDRGDLAMGPHDLDVGEFRIRNTTHPARDLYVAGAWAWVELPGALSTGETYHQPGHYHALPWGETKSMLLEYSGPQQAGTEISHGVTWFVREEPQGPVSTEDIELRFTLGDD